MYHCTVNFFFSGCPDDVVKLIKTISPPEHFSYTFTQGEISDSADIKSYDVIFACPDGTSMSELMLCKRKKGSQIILLAHKEQLTFSEEYINDVSDIWYLPLSQDELRFRFEKWQSLYKMQKDLWQTDQYLETTINSIPNLIWYKDKHGIHHKVNDSFCKAVNKTKDDVEGRDHNYIWDVDPNDPANEGNDCMESDMQVMRSQRTLKSEELVKTGDGEKLLTTFKSPLYDLDGSVMGTAGIGIDITLERAYEQEITQKNRVLETIFSSVDCGILCHSVDGSEILNVNKTALNILGYDSCEELMADGFDMIANTVSDEDKPKLRSTIKMLSEEGDSVSTEYSVRHKDGKTIHVMGNVKLLKENGKLFYQRFLLDCTEQKIQEMEQDVLLQDALLQANSANRAKTTFLSNMSHDIRTPMNAIIGFTNLALSHIDNKQQVEDYLNKIMISGNHLLSLINDILDMSQIESGKFQIKESMCSLSDILSELENMIYSNVKEKRQELSIEKNIVNDNICCDKLRLNRILLNVLSNSVKYTNEGGKISLKIEEKTSTAPDFSEYQFTITDNGIGMSKEYLSHIYELFSRAKNTTNSGIQGTGLGMAITKGIVDMMNGSIDVKSEEGVGTEVVIRLAFRLKDDAAADSEHKADSPKDDGINLTSKPIRILLAEDNLLNQEIATEILTDAGFMVEIADNGQIAIEMLTSSEPGYYKLILMDIQMSVMDGYEATRAIRALDDKRFADIPIFAMTANAFEEDRQEALRCGMNDHIAKPIDVDKLFSVLNRVITDENI